MKSKLFLLSLITFAFSVANAGTEPDPETDPIYKKEELLGVVQHNQTRKPVTKVNITAYLSAQKQKTVISDENGNYSFDDLKPGIYRFTFEKAGFKKVTRDKVVVKTDEAFQMNVEMEENKQFDLGPSALHFSEF